MNMLDEQALVDDLRRRGDHLVRAASLSCTVEQYRSAARKVGRKHGWRISRRGRLEVERNDLFYLYAADRRLT